MPITNITATEAHTRHTAGATLVDVRSTREFAAGHPTGAVNVPLLEHDEDTDQLVANPDFIRVMKAVFSPDTPLLVSCQSGVRSVRASQMLEAFGFQHIENVLGGFGGARDGSAAGWQPSGLPTENGASAGHAYQDLLAKADQDH